MEDERLSILIIDDENLNLQYLTSLLIADYDVCSTNDGQKALQLADSMLPDLIILDVVMPGMDGYEVLAKLKANPKTRHIPIIFLTCLNSRKDEEKGLSLGAQDYICKPIHPAIVKARVTNILELIEHRKLVEKIAMLDGLTGISNRRAYDERLLHEWSRGRRSKDPLSLAFVDIDFFKMYNDTYGHAAGDKALIMVAQTFSQGLKRSSDFVGRYGGEEFGLILPSTHLDGGKNLAERIRLDIRDLAIKHEASSVDDILTISVGGGTTIPGSDADMSDFTRHVDKMLYRAKADRNCVVWEFYEPSEENISEAS